MELNSTYREDSMNSDEEVDQPEKEINGRSYDCMFCKRGFTTAQALGGHMNIHRKDRAKDNKPSSINTNKQAQEQDYAIPIFYKPVSSYPKYYFSSQELETNYGTYYPTSTSYSRPSYTHHNNELCDLGMGLSLRFGSLHREDGQKKKKDGSEEDELDLELRLGHDP